MASIPAWAIGTGLGILAGNVLPLRLVSALSVALYGMFIAIIIPPARRERGVLFAVCMAVGLSCIFYYVPVFSFLSGGFSLIISAVIASVLAAWLSPVANAHEEVDA